MIREKIGKYIEGKIGTKLENSSSSFGDFCLTPGTLNEIAQKENSNPAEIAQNIAKELKSSFSNLVEKAEFEAGYLNIYLSKEAYLSELEEINNDIVSYLTNTQNTDKTIVFDYSSPNIAKPFSVGHLRSTIIGQANYNIHKVLGFKTIGINHLGDWGTQFGKLMVAIKKWGNEEDIVKNPIEKLNELYVKFHEESEVDKSLDDEARVWFKKLEDGDAQAREIWQKCVDWSMTEFDRIYKILDIKIDEATGESFYEDKLQDVIDELKEKGLLEESEGAQVVDLGEGMIPALIQKSDGATLYMTRDLAALKYRIEKYHPEEIIYHVGNDQSLHFKQLEAVVNKLGWKIKIVFAGHGMIRLADGKMSTRSGRTVLLDDLIKEARKRAMEIISQKNPDLNNAEESAQKIGISAIKYADLSSNRRSDVIFSFDKMVSLSGNSGPYLQYTYARACALIRKFKADYSIDPVLHLDDEGLQLAKKIILLKNKLEISAQNSTPNLVCEYAFELAEEFNTFYEKKKILTDEKDATAKSIYLVASFKNSLESLFDLLGIAKLEEI